MTKKKIRSADYTCPKCGSPFHFQVHRGWLMKGLSYFFPMRRLFCAKCKRSSYVLEKDED